MIFSDFAREAFPCCDFGQVEEPVLESELALPVAAGGGGAAASSESHHGTSLTQSVLTGVLTGTLIYFVTRAIDGWRRS